MDSADVATPLGAWASFRGYFTPATLFLVVNIVIGTIALTSRATQQRRRRQDHHHHYHDDAHGHYHLQESMMHPHQQQAMAYGDPYYHHQQQQPLYATPPPAPAPLVRTSSVLDRLRSFGLYRFRSGDFPPEYGAAAAGPIHAQDVFAPVEEDATTTTQQPHYDRSWSEPAAPAREETTRPVSRAKKPAASSEVMKAQVARAPARVVEAFAADARAEEFSAASFRRREPSPLQPEYHYQGEEYVPPPARTPAPAPAPLARTSSIMDRLRSLGLPSFLASEQPASIPPTDGFVITPPAAAAEKKQAHAHYDRSRSDPAWEQGSNKKEKKQQEAKVKMAKSSSETRKTAAPTTLAGETLASESVDARAEAFIDSFKQQQAQHHRREYVPPPAPATLARAPSVLERLRSFGLSRFRSGDLGPDLTAAEAAATPAAGEKKQQAGAGHYARSRSEPAPKQGKKEPRMSKSSSTVVEEETPEADQGVDARADDFINKFRQQLQLQRLNSLLNYKDVLTRGGG